MLEDADVHQVREAPDSNREPSLSNHPDPVTDRAARTAELLLSALATQGARHPRESSGAAERTLTEEELARLTDPGQAAPERSLETMQAALGERDALVRAHLLSSYLSGLQPADIPVSVGELDIKPAGNPKYMQSLSLSCAKGILDA